MTLPTADDIRKWPTSKLVSTLTFMTSRGFPKPPDARARIAAYVADELDRRVPAEQPHYESPDPIYVERAHRRRRWQKDDSTFLDRVLAAVPDLVAAGKVRRVGPNCLDVADLTEEESSRLLGAEAANRGRQFIGKHAKGDR